MSWRDLIAQADAAVDTQWGEQVRFLPYKAGNYMQATTPDTGRNEADIVAVVYARGAMGTRSNTNNVTLMAKRMEADFLASVQAHYLPDVREKDRLRLTERSDQICEVSYIETGSNGRYLLHLVKNVT